MTPTNASRVLSGSGICGSCGVCANDPLHQPEGSVPGLRASSDLLFHLDAIQVIDQRQCATARKHLRVIRYIHVILGRLHGIAAVAIPPRWHVPVSVPPYDFAPVNHCIDAVKREYTIVLFCKRREIGRRLLQQIVGCASALAILSMAQGATVLKFAFTQIPLGTSFGCRSESTCSHQNKRDR